MRIIDNMTCRPFNKCPKRNFYNIAIKVVMKSPA